MELLYVFIDVVVKSVLFTLMCAAVNNVYMICILSTVFPKKRWNNPKTYKMKWDILDGAWNKIVDSVILPLLLFFRTVLQQQLCDFDISSISISIVGIRYIVGNSLECGTTVFVPDVHVGSITKEQPHNLGVSTI